MKLESKCKNCGKYIEFTENVSDRAELSLEKGENIELFCKECSTKSCHHPNDINAKKNRVISIIGFLIFVIGTILIYHFIGEFYLEYKEQFESKKNFSSFGKLLGAFAIPFIIFQLIENIQMRNVRRFNSYKIKD
ncbi:hypothetical protein ACFQ5N_08320 [Lutibacter holmesii]|uniref:Uncharacterized protein n=1 Tax=Lutibacter holmesii TaxID=1137985 RepID=A0ABW3WQ99_9FLAO